LSTETHFYLLSDEPVDINADRPVTSLTVWNTGDRAVQVGSHYHFFEANRALRFDRAAAYGQRLDIPAGTAVRFEPGARKEVPLVPIGGARRVVGLNGLAEGALDDPEVRARALAAAKKRGFAGVGGA